MKFVSLFLAFTPSSVLLTASAQADGDFKTSHKAVGIDRNDAAKPTPKAGEAAAHVQAVSSGAAKGRCGRPTAA